jgi:HAE1 family hydrophobic/amphiphilic exporter-1
MTTFAMIGAMIPTVFSTGIGSATNGAMALAIIGGLSASTILTLLIIPSLYKIMYPFDKWLKSFYELKKI